MSGELDITTAPRLTERLLEVAAERPEKLILDLHRVAFIDLSGAKAIAALQEALGDGCPVIIHKPRPSARKALATVGLLPDLGDDQARWSR